MPDPGSLPVYLGHRLAWSLDTDGFGLHDRSSMRILKAGAPGLRNAFSPNETIHRPSAKAKQPSSALVHVGPGGSLT
jgi:hypothetical protein